MPPLLFECPVTGMSASAWLASAEQQKANAPESYLPIDCPACGGRHFVSAVTGNALGKQREAESTGRRNDPRKI